jgi:hypothetical protein
MSAQNKSRSSFSSASRWKIGSDAILRTVLVLAVIVMLNYVGAKCYHRFYWSAETSAKLSSRTLTVLRSLTNHVEVTLYYDTRDRSNFYSDIVELLNAYRDANKNISIRTVDYERDPAEAMKVKEKYDLPASLSSPNAPPSKDLIIFACGNRHDVVPGSAIVATKTVQLSSKDPEYDPNENKLQFVKQPVSFNGELIFTSRLLAVAAGQPLQAYFLQGHGESSLTDVSDGGYSKFALGLAQNDIAVNTLELLGQAEVPANCGLLIIAAPVRDFSEAELQAINRYLTQGGKLMVFFNYASLQRRIGLDDILRQWGVNVLADYVKDNTSSDDHVVWVRDFNNSTFVSPLSQLALEMVLPRPIEKLPPANPPSNTLQVDALASSSENATLAGNRAAAPRQYSLITAVEQKPAVGTVNPRGNTRIVIAGDSLFLDNQLIEAAANRDFLNYAANWLCNREQLLAGIGPRPVTQFRLALSDNQKYQLFWLLLGPLPGGVLLLGWLVWLVRRQ